MNPQLLTYPCPSLGYTAYGLPIRSAIALSEFLPSDGGAGEIVVRLGATPDWVAEVRDSPEYLSVSEGVARFWFKDVAAFTVKHGSEIAVHPEAGIDLSLLRLYVQGMMMAMALHQRGHCVLHASVVDMGGYAVAFLGHVGAGKSSLAAALYARGYRVLSDDNAAVDCSSGTPVVTPAYPHLKLFPGIASVLGFENEDLGLLHPSQAKLRGSVQNRFDATALPLRRLYVLGRDHAPEVTRLSRLNMIVELVRHSVPTRWGHPGDPHQLKQCGFLVSNTEGFALQTFRDCGTLPDIADAVIKHCGAAPAPRGLAGACGREL